MKTPRIDLGSVGEFLLRHGEKIVAGVVGLVAVLLIWGGVSAMRNLSVTDAQTPEEVNRVVTQARGHIDSAADVPLDQLPKRQPLAVAIDPWRTPLVPWWTGTAPATLSMNDPPAVAVLDRPLFEEAAKRGRPAVFPLEDLRAVAGLAVLPVVAAPGAPAVPPPESAPKPKKPEGGGRPRAGQPAPDMNPAPEMPGVQPGVVDRGRIVPYVIVTGLIPVSKQQEEYRNRFDACGFRDAKRDSPLWCDFEIDRGTIGADGKESWTTIDLAAVARKRTTEWGAPAVAAPLALDPEFLLGPTEDARSRQTTPLPFCSPLPQRIDGDWNLGDLHPWIVERLSAKRAAAAALMQEPAAPAEPADAGPGREGPGFAAPEESPAGPAPVAGPVVELPPYRLFRFVDTDIAPGTTYRYRVRLKVWNPNWDKVPERMRPHLEDPADALDQKLTSADSTASTDVAVPDMTRVLVGTLRDNDMKELKIRRGSGTLELLVLGRSDETGRFALRALVGDPGVVVDVDEKFNQKNQRDRARGERIVTRRLLVDARGRQEERSIVGTEKGKAAVGIPEPLEVICLRPDGSFEFASVDGSEGLIAANVASLPARSTKPDAKSTLPPDGWRNELPVEPPPPTGPGRRGL